MNKTIMKVGGGFIALIALIWLGGMGMVNLHGQQENAECGMKTSDALTDPNIANPAKAFVDAAKKDCPKGQNQRP